MSWFYVEMTPTSSEKTSLHCSCCSSKDQQEIVSLVGWYTNPELALAAAREAHPEIIVCSCCRKRQPVETSRSASLLEKSAVLPASSSL